MAKFAKILGTGSYLPAEKIDNETLAQRLAKDGLETSDEWIFSRSGIKARHFAAHNELTSDLAVNAATKALEAAGKALPQSGRASKKAASKKKKSPLEPSVGDEQLNLKLKG